MTGSWQLFLQAGAQAEVVEDFLVNDVVGT